MISYSPLRYPGGKRRLASLVGLLLEENALTDIQYAEPYAGGASIALSLLFNEHASTIRINDLSRPVYAFWKSALDDTDSLCNRINATPVTIDEWHRQRDIFREERDAGRLDLGFAAFFLNRTNRSGILSGGVIGGRRQSGLWKLDARFNKEDLIRRIRKIGRYRTRIEVSQEDAAEFIDRVSGKPDMRMFFFIDPPYIDHGDDLYLNDYSMKDHRSLAEQITSLDQDWIVTYDYDAAVRHCLYAGQTRLSFSLHYSAQRRRFGREAMFLSDSLDLPRAWHRAQRFIISPPHSRHSVEAHIE